MRLAISLFLIGIAALLAGETHEISVGIPLHVSVGVDNLLSSVLKIGVTGGLNFGYRYFEGIQSHTIRLLIGGGVLVPQYVNTGFGYTDGFTDQLYRLGLHIRSTFQIYENDVVLARLGAYALGSFEVFVMDHFFSVSWLGEAGIGIAGDLTFRFEPHSVELMFALPLGVLLSRPSWSVYLIEDELALDQDGIASVIFGRTRIASFNEYVRLELAALYTYDLNEKISLGTRYDFLYRYVGFPRTSMTFEHFLSFSVLIRIPEKKK